VIDSFPEAGAFPERATILILAGGMALVGFVLGVLVARAVSWMLTALAEDFGSDPPAEGEGRWRAVSRLLPPAAALFVATLFCWEVGLRGPSPAGISGTAGLSPHIERFAAHVALCSLLTMATLVDLRYRVIPDLITVPGTLCGLALVALAPDILLPVACEVPRAFAAPLAVPDVLGAFGPLACGPPEIAPLRPWASLACFVAWWSVSTSPAPDARPWQDSRNWILLVGLAAVAAVSAGGLDGRDAARHAAALETALVGAIVSGGLVLATRVAASRAVGREAMGMGDVTLMAMVGAWCGWQAGVVAFFLAAFIGLAQGAWGWMRHRDNELPYGPSLSVASVVVIVAWRFVWELGRPLLEAPVQMAVTLAAVVVLTGVTLAVWARLRSL
jgi:leader peptidase (prepilin peptidase)/N-methyltransferase